MIVWWHTLEWVCVDVHNLGILAAVLGRKWEVASAVWTDAVIAM